MRRRRSKVAKAFRPDDLEIVDVERVIGWRVASWQGHCYEVATAIVEAGLVEGTAVYGHYLGAVAPESFFGHKRDLPFIQHGWIVLKDGRLLDPTRWVFEDVKPYLWIGNSDDYDEGGNRFREVMRTPCPGYDMLSEPVVLDLDPEAAAAVEQLVGRPPQEWVKLRLLEMSEVGKYPDRMPTTITRDQVFWLANQPYVRLGAHVGAIYEALDKIGLIEFVPIDNRRRAKREAA